MTAHVPVRSVCRLHWVKTRGILLTVTWRCKQLSARYYRLPWTELMGTTKMTAVTIRIVVNMITRVFDNVDAVTFDMSWSDLVRRVLLVKMVFNVFTAAIIITITQYFFWGKAPNIVYFMLMHQCTEWYWMAKSVEENDRHINRCRISHRRRWFG